MVKANFEKSEKIAKLSNEELLKLDDENAVVIEIGIRLGEKCNCGDNLANLYDCEKQIYLATTFEWELYSGGFESFFLQEYGNLFKETVEALQELKLDRTLKIFEEIFKTLEDAPSDESLRDEFFHKILEEDPDFEKKISDAEALFYELPPSYMEHIKYEYIKNNEEKFKLYGRFN